MKRSNDRFISWSGIRRAGTASRSRGRPPETTHRGCRAASRQSSGQAEFEPHDFARDSRNSTRKCPVPQYHPSLTAGESLSDIVGIARASEALLAALVSAVLYISLYGELPYHDVARFAEQVNSGGYVWDIGHIFLQPATLLWHIHLGFGETAEASQKHINTFAAACGMGMFYVLLLRLAIPRWQRILATLAVMASGSLIILAPSGHMKLLAFPFVNASLLVLVGWEQRGRSDSDGGRTIRLVTGAVLLAVAASFLASALATAPFAA